MNIKTAKKKRIISVILAVITTLSVLPLSIFATADDSVTPEGNWTASGNYSTSFYGNNITYNIYNEKHLAGLAYLVNTRRYSFKGKNIKINNNLDLSAHYWEPIGTADSPFCGNFDGQGYTISGLTVNPDKYSSKSYVGLFGKLGNSDETDMTSSGNVKNTKLKSVNIVGKNYVGGIAGNKADSSLTNCSVEGTIKGESYVGGILGGLSAGGDVSDCTSSATVSGTNSVGGIVGKNDESTIFKCINKSTVSSFATSKVTQAYTGGIAGYSSSGIEYCANFGKIKGYDSVGGIVGLQKFGALVNCYNASAVVATSSAVGAIGVCESGALVKNCYYLKGTANNGISSTSASAKSGAVTKTSSQFGSGEVTYLLNNGATENQAFFQNISSASAKDPYPVFSGPTVYKVKKYKKCDKSDVPTDIYSNANADVVPSHVFKYEADTVNCCILEKCKNCDYLEKAQLKVYTSVSYLPDRPSQGAYIHCTDGWQGGQLEITYKDNHKVGTAKAYVEKDGAKVEAEFKITPKLVVDPAIDDTKFVYNGKEQTYAIPESDYYTVTGNKQTQVGTYAVTVSLKDTVNFKWIEGGDPYIPYIYEFKIEPKTIGIEWGETDLYYNGENQAPQAMPVKSDLIDGENVEFIVDGARKNANAQGEYYTATVTGIKGANSQNYKLPDDCTKTFRILKARQTAPNVLGVNETIRNKNDGKITGVSNAMEYRKKDSDDYIAVNGTELTDLAPGTYFVRYAASENYDASPESTVEISKGKQISINSIDTAGYKLTPDKSSYNYNETATLHLEIKAGYSKSENFKITVGGKTVLPDENNNCTVVLNDSRNFTEQETDYLLCKAEVFGIADITVPNVEISIEENKFNSFMNAVTFGLFFKETKNVTVTASDLGSGIKSVEYMLSDTAFADKDAVTGNWTALTLTDGKAEFAINPNNKSFIYVRVADESGNINVINSEGIVIYTDSQVITDSVTFTKMSGKAVSFKLKLNGNTVAQLHNGNDIIDSGNYDVAEDGTVTLKADYLNTLPAKEYTVRIICNPMGEQFAKGDAPEVLAVKLTVQRNSGLVENISDVGKIYNGSAVSTPVFDKLGGDVTVEYKEIGADDETYTSTAPKNAGDYTVRITVAQDENYNTASATANFTIYKKDVTIIDTSIENSKTYDGTIAAKIIDNGTVFGKVNGDDVTVAAGTATYSDKSVGTDKTVHFEGFTLAGNDAKNYNLISQPEFIKADITKKELTIGGLKIKDKAYDTNNTAQFDDTPVLVGIAENGDVRLVNGVPTFENAKIGKNIPIKFTEFTLIGADSANYTLIQPQGITASIFEYAANGSEYSVNSNDWINSDFIITANDGWLISLTDTANGDWTTKLTASNETENGSLTFHVKNVKSGAISSAVTEQYKIDKTMPSGEIKLNERTSFQTVLNKISFGLFFKNDVNVKLSASDNASGIKTVMYYKSDKALSNEEITDIAEWVQNSDFDITAEDSKKFIVYARIEDNAGNVAYIGSDGAVFDTVAPEIVGAENGKTYYVTKNISVDDENLRSLTLNGKEVEKSFSIVGNTDAVYIIKATDKAGNESVCTVYMKPISSISNAIAKLTADNVKSSDSQTIEDVEKQLGNIEDDSNTEAERHEMHSALTKCEELKKRMAEVTAEIERLISAVNGYSPEKVGNNDKSAIEKLIADIDILLGGDNITVSERTELGKLKSTSAALLDKIARGEKPNETPDSANNEPTQGTDKPQNDNHSDDKNTNHADGSAESGNTADNNGSVNGVNGANVSNDSNNSADANGANASNSESKTEDSPQTGVNGGPALWLVLLFVNGVIVIAAYLGKRKRHIAQ